MLCRVDATCFKALLLALVALAACITPATSQIHWNRGWGAGGSMGKRSSSAPSAVSASVPLAEAAAAAAAECDMTLASDCSVDFSCLSTLLLKIIESEVSRAAMCEARGRSLGSSAVVADEREQLTRFPWWMATRKTSASDQ
ncbi:uncharacterized protein [Panulirus ornatus]|uniref:uncharacterized protein n=1 Tax=Panulirus ornatus TaxID=150431 RepID=UPI003A8B7EA8